MTGQHTGSFPVRPFPWRALRCVSAPHGAPPPPPQPRLCIWYVFAAGYRCDGGSGRDVSNVSYSEPPGVLPRPRSGEKTGGNRRLPAAPTPAPRSPRPIPGRTQPASSDGSDQRLFAGSTKSRPATPGYLQTKAERFRCQPPSFRRFQPPPGGSPRPGPRPSPGGAHDGGRYVGGPGRLGRDLAARPAQRRRPATRRAARGPPLGRAHPFHERPRRQHHRTRRRLTPALPMTRGNSRPTAEPGGGPQAAAPQRIVTEPRADSMALTGSGPDSRAHERTVTTACVSQQPWAAGRTTVTP